MKASIVIAAHNEGEALSKTIQSCIETVQGIDHEIVLADDASTDGSVEAVARSYPHIRVHRHPQRQGASPAKAMGARHAVGEVLVFLDGHTNPAYGSIARLVENVAKTNGHAIVTPAVAALDVLRWKNDESQVGHGYVVNLETLDCGWQPLNELHAVSVGGRRFFESAALIGCVLAISRELYDSLWGFDSHMKFWGVEDLDFGLKCWLMGHQILHDPDALIGHRFRDTFESYSVPVEHVLVNQIRTARKHFTHGVWAAWLEGCRQRNTAGLNEHPEGLWARAWELFNVNRASVEQERAYLHARRTRDEFWFAQRFGLAWPALAAPAGLRASFAPSSSPSPKPTCSITSQTVATTPPDRTRKKIGVGEVVTLNFTPGSATWTLAGPGTLSAAAGASVTYTAADRAGSATITGKSAAGATCNITFAVVEPSGIVMRQNPGSHLHHTLNRPDSGLQTQIFLTPADVSFQNVQYHEVDVPAVATGVYAPFNGVGHDPHPATITVNGVVPGLGSQANGIDNIYSGDPGTAAPFAPGSITFNIPYEFQVGAGAFKRFTVVAQVSSLAADRTTLTSSKGGASVTCKVSDPTSTP